MATPTTPDLWPDDIGQQTGELGPAALLKSQAALLAEKTKGLVTAEVRGEQDPRDGKFVDNFYLVGPTINYQYLLFALSYPIEFYPARFISMDEKRENEHGVTVENDDDLMKQVGKVLSQQKTRQVINAIIQRSK